MMFNILKATLRESRFFTLQFSHALVALILFTGLLFSTPLAWAASPLFLVQENSGNDIVLKFESGALTAVGNIGFGDVRGLAYDATSDTLFGVSRTSNRLITIDPSTGTGTVVCPDNYLPPGSNTAEISVNAASDMFGEGHLYDQSAVDTLLSVDKTTGIATVIGNFGVPALCGLAFDHTSGILYGTSFVGELYTIDQTIGTATFVGQITGTNGGVARIAFDQATGILYGITYREQLVTVDLTTLVATEVAQFTISTQIYSLDFISQVPGVECVEDDTGALDIAGAAGAPGFTVTIPVRIQDAPNNVESLGFEVVFPDSILAYTGFTRGPLVENFDFFDVNIPEPGILRIGGFETGEHIITAGAGGDVVLLTFDVLTCEPGSGYQLDLQELKDDLASWSISHGCFQCGCSCDINDDGEVTPQDSLCAFQKYLGICPTACGPCEDICCDVNQDDDCTPADALEIFREYLGLPSVCSS